MRKRRVSTAAARGASMAAVHFVAICVLATIVAREVSGEYWEYAGIFDLPVNFVLFLLSPLLNLLSGVAPWPDVTFLPGITGSWDRFLIPFLVYGVLGTAVWFLLGWAVVRIGGSRHLP